MLLLNTSGPDLILVEDIAACWRQTAVHYLAEIKNENKRIIIDLSGLPELSSTCGVFVIKIQGRPDLCWHSVGGKILEQKQESENMLTLKLLPEGREKKVVIFPVDPIGDEIGVHLT